MIVQKRIGKWSEQYRLDIFDIETSIGLAWELSVRDEFRHMWE